MIPQWNDTRSFRIRGFCGRIVSSSIIDDVKNRRQLETRTYGYDDAFSSKLKVLDGQLDVEKFVQGGYILLTDIIGDHTEGASIYKPGEKVKLLVPTEESELIEDKDETGEVTGYPLGKPGRNRV